MNNITQLGLTLGITNGHIRLGDAAFIAANISRMLRHISALKRFETGEFLKDVKNLKNKSASKYANDIVAQVSLFGQMSVMFCDESKISKFLSDETFSDCIVEYRAYSYLYLQLWPKIADIIGNKLDASEYKFESTLRITELTYARFYSEYESNPEKMNRLRNDIFYWATYNHLGMLESVDSIRITEKNELLVPMCFEF